MTKNSYDAIAASILANKIDAITHHKDYSQTEKNEKIGGYLKSYYEFFMPDQANSLMESFKEQTAHTTQEPENDDGKVFHISKNNSSLRHTG